MTTIQGPGATLLAPIAPTNTANFDREELLNKCVEFYNLIIHNSEDPRIIQTYQEWRGSTKEWTGSTENSISDLLDMANEFSKLIENKETPIEEVQRIAAIMSKLLDDLPAIPKRDPNTPVVCSFPNIGHNRPLNFG